MIQLRKDLDISIEFIEPIRDPNPSISYSKTFIETIRKYKGKYRKVLMFEDDVYTDLLKSEIESRLILANIPSLDYDILSLGSQSYIRELINPHLYKVNAFGYMHAVCFNLEKLNENFINSIEDRSIKHGLNIDCSLSRSLMYLDNVFSLKEPIFFQKNFTSGINRVSRNCKLDFRYTRDQPISTNTWIEFKKDNAKEACYLNQFGEFDCYAVTFFLTSPAEEGEFSLVASDYDTGFYFFNYNKCSNNYWLRVKIPPCDKIVVEMERSSDGKIIHRQVVNINDIPFHE